jgi:hypothetical protein
MASRYEGSAKDKAHDKREAKKRGMSLKAWENSPADKRMDAAEQRKLDRKRKKPKRRKREAK